MLLELLSQSIYAERIHQLSWWILIFAPFHVLMMDSCSLVALWAVMDFLLMLV